MAKRILEFETTWRAADKHKRRVIVIANRMGLFGHNVCVLQAASASICKSGYDSHSNMHTRLCNFMHSWNIPQWLRCDEIPASSLTPPYIYLIEARQTQPASSFSSSASQAVVQLPLSRLLVELWRQQKHQSP